MEILTKIQDLINNINPLVVAVTIAVGILFGLIALYIRQTIHSQNENAQILSQVAESFESELAAVQKSKKAKGKYAAKWSNYWERRLIGSGLHLPLIDRDNVGDRMTLFFGVLFLILFIVFAGQILAAAFLTFVVFAGISLATGFLAKKRDRKISGQVPGFLQSMKASVQNNALPQNALMNAIKDSPNELYAELQPLEVELAAGGSLKETLLRFSSQTTVKELKFLMSCIILSCDKGISMEKQLTIIQDAIFSRQRRLEHIQHAISEVMPSITVSSVVIPAIFLFMYLQDKSSRDYWFQSFTAWVVFLIAMATWWGGLYLAKRQINKVENLG